MGRGSRVTGRRQAGFSLVELLVVLSLVGVILASAIGSVESFVPRWRLRQAAQDVASAIRSTRARAVQERLRLVMPIDVGRSRYSVLGRSSGTATVRETSGGVTRIVARLPPGVVFQQPGTADDPVTLRDPITAERAAVFNSRGRLDSVVAPGFVYLANPVRRIYARVQVDLAGNVRVQYLQGSAWR